MGSEHNLGSYLYTGFWRIGLLITGMLFSSVTITHSQPSIQSNYVVTQYGQEEGLPQSSVNDIIQTEDGYIWLATFGGLVRFDGRTFTTYNRYNTPGMISDRILKLFKDDDGSIWLFPENTQTILLRFKDGKCEVFTFPEENATVINMYLDGEGRSWITAFSKAYRIVDGKILQIPVQKNDKLREQALKNKHGVWMLTGEKVIKTIEDSIVEVYDFSEEYSGQFIDIIEYPDHSKNLFIGTNASGVLSLKNGVIKTYDSSTGLPNNNFLGFEKGENGDLWAYIFEHIIFWNGSQFEAFSYSKLPDKVNHKSIYEDTEQNIWIGTGGQGLFKLRPSVVTMIDKKDGLDNQIMLSMTSLDNGKYLFSSNCGGVFEWENGKAIFSSIHEYFNSGCNWSVFEDSKQRIWVGGRGMYRTESLDQKGVYYDASDGFTGNVVFAMNEDESGNIWIGTADGLFKYQDQNFTHYTREEGLYHNDIRFIYADHEDNIWLGTSEGLNVMYKDTLVKKPLLDLYQESPPLKQPYVRAIHQDSDGYMWIGTYGHGLFRIKDEEIVNITTKDGLYDNIISHIVEDEFGNFWMGSNRGISSVSRSQLNDYINGEVSELSTHIYGTGKGMNSAETNGGFQPSTITDENGNIYFPTVAGVAVVSTRDVKNNKVPPPVYIKELKSIDTTFTNVDSISLSYDTPYLEISYTAINFSEPENIAFKYRMYGLDDTWIDVGNRRTALYSKIPPGSYTFQVIASNNDGVWNETGATLAINIVPPFWQRNWFYGILSLLVFGMLFSIYFIRISSLRKKNERQKIFTEKLIESQEQERHRIARELHDGLGQQILIIKNKVEWVKHKYPDSDRISNELVEIQHSAEQSINDIRRISHDLRPVALEKFGLRESLKNLCEELDTISGMDWSYYIDDIDGFIPVEKEIHFYRIIQEGINNILKHSDATEASLIIKINDREMQVVLSDNGRGFEISELGNKHGLGFLGIKERVDTLGGSLSYTSSEGKGTTMKINLSAYGYKKT